MAQTNIVRLLLSFISLYRYIVISFIFIESACLTGWPSPLSTSSPAANQSRRGEYTKVAALQVGLLSLNVLADAASSNSLCRQVSLFSYLQFWICAVVKGCIYQGCCITGYSRQDVWRRSTLSLVFDPRTTGVWISKFLYSRLVKLSMVRGRKRYLSSLPAC